MLRNCLKKRFIAVDGNNQSVPYYQQLIRETLLAKYDRISCPISNTGDPVIVSILPYLFNILDVVREPFSFFVVIIIVALLTAISCLDLHKVYSGSKGGGGLHECAYRKP
jgi:hypothetical protein